MFELKALYSSIARLTAAVTRSAELFETANRHLEEQLGYEPAVPALEHSEVSPRSNGKGRHKATAK